MVMHRAHLFIAFLAFLACLSPSHAADHAWGDSITYGTDASPLGDGYVPLLATALATSIANHGVSGDEVPDMTAHVYTVTPAVGDTHTVMIGTNDERIYCPSPCSSSASATIQGYYKSGLEALIAYLATPVKHTGRDGSVAYAGPGWTNTAVYGIGENSNHNGDTATFSVAGSVIYLGMIQQDNAPGAFSVTVDGTVAGNFSTLTSGLGPTVNGVTYGAQLIRIGGLANVAHTVVIAVTSLSGAANRVYLDWYAGNYQPTGLSKVFVSNIIYAESYAAGGSGANVDVFNAKVAAAIAELAGDGLSVLSVDSNGVLNYSADMDGAYHPINSGHAKIEAAFFAAIGGPPPFWIWAATQLWAGTPLGGGSAVYCISPVLPVGACATPLTVP